jgi:hypothetical protein
VLGNIRRRADGNHVVARLAPLEHNLVDYRGIVNFNFLAGILVGPAIPNGSGLMKEIHQVKALGMSLKAFSVLMITVCFIYEIITPSVQFMTLWFSYLVGVVLYIIGVLIGLL